MSIDSGWSLYDIESQKIDAKGEDKEKSEEFLPLWDLALRYGINPAEKNDDSGNKIEKANTTLGLKDSVGVNCNNDSNDIALVKSKLIMNGFLNMIEISQESLFDAIGKFQSEVIGIKSDKVISVGGTTERALATYYTNPIPKWRYTDFDTNLENTFTLSTEKAISTFAETMKGVIINSATNASNVNLKALLALRFRLNQFGYSFKKVNLDSILSTRQNEYSKDQKAVINSLISETIDRLIEFQDDYQDKYLKILPKFVSGEIKDGDDTYIFLRDFKSHTFSWFIESGEIKKVKANNLQNTNYTENRDGLSIAGTISPRDLSSEDFQKNAGLDESRSKALKAASIHEGNFDAVNTFDVAKISFGFIQFAGGNRSLEYLLALIKSEKPTVFQTAFAKYGIDVEYRTNKSDNIIENTSRIVFHDSETQKTYRGLEAEDKISQSPIYAAVFMKAAESKDIQEVQIKLAKKKYIDKSENSKLGLNVKILKVLKGEMGDPKIFYNGDIEAYKLTEEYKINNKNKHISYSTLDLKGLKLGDVLQSEKELAALYGTYINSPARSLEAFRKGILQIIKDNGLTTEEEVKNIHPIELLKIVKTKAIVKDEDGKDIANAIHQKRIQDTIDSEELN